MTEVFSIYTIIITTTLTSEIRIPRDLNVLSRPRRRGNVTKPGHRLEYMALMEIGWTDGMVMVVQRWSIWRIWKRQQGR